MNKKNNFQNLQGSIIVAHPAQQHSYRLATAIHKKGLLNSYCTTIYYKPNKLLYKILRIILGPSNNQRMKSRQNKFFENKVKQFNEFIGLLFLFLGRIDKKRIIEPYIYRYLIEKFGNNIAKYAMITNVKAVILYDTTGFYCFQKLKKKSNIIKILDMSSAAATYIVKIISEDKNNAHTFLSSYQLKMKTFTSKAMKTYTSELLLADYFLVPSNFVRKSLLDTGVKYEQIYLVPYGVDINKFNMKLYEEHIQTKQLQFLFVGRLEAAKGIYYLLESFKQVNRQDIKLILVGTMNDHKLFEPYKQYFNYLGSKLSDEMPDVYKSADVFIFPSLFEGFSLSLIEAMASGLPVIASSNSGVNDLITDGKEGFTVPVMDIAALKEKIVWFCEHKASIKQMGMNARKVAEECTWPQYEENVAKAIIDILNSNIPTNVEDKHDE